MRVVVRVRLREQRGARSDRLALELVRVRRVLQHPCAPQPAQSHLAKLTHVATGGRKSTAGAGQAKWTKSAAGQQASGLQLETHLPPPKRSPPPKPTTPRAFLPSITPPAHLARMVRGGWLGMR